MNGTMLNESMTDTTAKENSGVLDMNNMAFYYHALPPVDDILRSWVNGASTEKIIPDWNESSIDFFVVVNVSDDEIRNFYTKVRQRTNKVVTKIKRYLSEHGKVRTNDFLLKVNLETKQYSQYDIGSNELWQADSNIYFTAVDSENKMGIYKLDLKQDKMTNLYTDNDNYGEISISYIQNQTIYFIKKLSVPGNHILCSVQLDGKDYKEYCEYPRIWNAFPIDNKIYFYALNESGGKNATYEFDNKTNTSVKAEIPLKGQLRLHNGYVYGSFTSETNKFGLYRLPIDNLSAQPEFVSDKGTKIIDFTDDFVIISDGAGEDDVTPNNENPNYFVTNVDGSSSERCWDLFSAYQYAFGFSSASGNEESSSESESSNGFTIPDELTQLFDETVVDIYGDNPLPKPLFSEGGSNCYQAPDSEATMYYFSISESGEAYSYLLAIEGPLNLLIPGKDTATIAELKELFGDSFSFNFSDNMGGYTASAQIGEYGISFGTFESEENATVTAFRISK